jgi:hypothetical protein
VELTQNSFGPRPCAPVSCVAPSRPKGWRTARRSSGGSARIDSYSRCSFGGPASRRLGSRTKDDRCRSAAWQSSRLRPFPASEALLATPRRPRTLGGPPVVATRFWRAGTRRRRPSVAVFAMLPRGAAAVCVRGRERLRACVGAGAGGDARRAGSVSRPREGGGGVVCGGGFRAGMDEEARL